MRILSRWMLKERRNLRVFIGTELFRLCVRKMGGENQQQRKVDIRLADGRREEKDKAGAVHAHAQSAGLILTFCPVCECIV